jgi:hypothetical protein
MVNQGGRKTATPIKLYISTFITVYPPAPAYRQAGSLCSGEVDESSFNISSDELNADSISDIQIAPPDSGSATVS